MIRVALVVGRLGVGGTETALVKLASGMDRSRFEPFVVTLQERGPLAERLRDIEIVELGCRRKACLRTYLALRRVLRERRPDIVHSFLFTENLFCRWIGVGAVISGIRGSLEEGKETERSWRLALEWLTFGRARAVVSNTDYYRRLYAQLGLDAGRIVVIPNGVDPVEADGEGVRRELGVGPDELLIACVGRLVETKGHEDVLRAGEGFRMVFVGDGPLRARLEGRGAVLAGLQRDASGFVAAADIVTLASRVPEGMPNVLLEAMAAGRPVVATRTGGIPEVVADGETGILVPPGDPGALRRAFERLAADRELRERMGRAGRERAAREFSVERMVNSFQTLYLNLTATPVPV